MSIAEALYQDYVEGGEDRVNQAVHDQEPETLFADFKESSTTNGAMQDKDRKNLGKNISGFANASGGILVWGVKAKNVDDRNPQSKAVELKPIPNIQRFYNDLNSQIGQVVQRTVDGVVNHLIERSDGSGYAVTLVPESSRKPHMCIAAEEKRYYLRTGSQTIAIDHVLVEALMFVRARPNLEVVVDSRAAEPTDQAPSYRRVRAFLSVRNAGEVLARDVAVNLVTVNQRTYNGQLHFRQGSLISLLDGSSTPRHTHQFLMTQGVPIYPGTDIHNIEVLQALPAASQWNDEVEWTIHADGFTKSGVVSINPANDVYPHRNRVG